MTRRAKPPADPFLTEDAYNRAARSLIQGFAIDVAVAVAFAFSAAFSTAASWSEVPLTVLTFSVAKSVVQAIAAFVMRRFADRSRFPTPIPPSD